MLVLFTEIRRPKGMRGSYNRALKATLKDTAEYWHSKLLAPHFGPSNSSRFELEPRRPLYLDVIKKFKGRGQGKFVLLQLTGRSLRYMKAFARITSTSSQARVVMSPPGYFANPFIGRLRDGGIVSRQPNKPAEATRVDSRDAQALSAYAASREAIHFERSLTPQTTRIQ